MVLAGSVIARNEESMSSISQRSHTETLKSVLLEIVIAIKETNQPVEIRQLVETFSESPPSNIYSYCTSLEKRGWAKMTTQGGFKAIFPTIQGFRLIGEAPTPGLAQKPSKESILVVSMITESPNGKFSNQTLYTKSDFKEVLTLVAGRDDLSSLFIKKEELV